MNNLTLYQLVQSLASLEEVDAKNLRKAFGVDSELGRQVEKADREGELSDCINQLFLDLLKKCGDDLDKQKSLLWSFQDSRELASITQARTRYSECTQAVASLLQSKIGVQVKAKANLSTAEQVLKEKQDELQVLAMMQQELEQLLKEDTFAPGYKTFERECR